MSNEASTSHYCQGLNFIAGLLLLATEDEEATFWLLRALLERLLPDYYGRHMTGLLTDIEVLAELVRERMPQVHAHLAKHEVSWAIMTTKWFVCLFAEVLPIETVLRIWDSLFLEGSKVLFRVAITLVAQGQEKILAARGLGEIMAAFKEAASGPQVTDCHAFLKAIFKQPKSLKRAHIEQLRASCRERVIAARR